MWDIYTAWETNIKKKVQHWYLVMYINLNPLVLEKYYNKLICESFFTIDDAQFYKKTT